MAKTIQFTFDGEDYELEFSRRIVKDMEREGFSLPSLNSKPVSMYPILFAGAFRLHHKRTSKETIERIYKQIKGKEELAEALIDMYTEAVDTLFDEPDENEKNVEWKANF